MLVHAPHGPRPLVIRQRCDARTQLLCFAGNRFCIKAVRLEQQRGKQLCRPGKQAALARHGKPLINYIRDKSDQLCLAAFAHNRLQPRAIQIVQLCRDCLPPRIGAATAAQDIGQQCRFASSLRAQRKRKHRAQARGLGLFGCHAGQSDPVFQ